MSLFAAYHDLGICAWPTPNHGAIWTDEEINTAKSMVNAGFGAVAVASKLGRRIDGVCIKMTQKEVLYKDMQGNYHVKNTQESTQTMTKTIEHKTFVNGTEIKTASDDVLLKMLSVIFVNVDKLKDTLGSGAYFDKQIKEYNEAKEAITNELNNRV